MVRIPWVRAATKRQREIILPEQSEVRDHRPIRAETRATLVRAIALGRRWLDELMSGSASARRPSRARRLQQAPCQHDPLAGLPGTRSGPGCGRRSAATWGRGLAADRRARRVAAAVADARAAALAARPSTHLAFSSPYSTRSGGSPIRHPTRAQPDLEPVSVTMRTRLRIRRITTPGNEMTRARDWAQEGGLETVKRVQRRLCRRASAPNPRK